MGFNGEVLVGRGEAFTCALHQFWNWEEEVLAHWPLRDDWRAVHVRTPADSDELAELAEAVDGPVLACEVFEGSTGHIRAISTVGQWEVWLNPREAAHLRAWNTVDTQVGGGLYPEGTAQDHARVKQLEAQFTAESDTERPACARAATVWAAQSGLHADTAHVEHILATRWESSAQKGFFTLLSALGVADPDTGTAGTETVQA